MRRNSTAPAASEDHNCYCYRHHMSLAAREIGTARLGAKEARLATWCVMWREAPMSRAGVCPKLMSYHDNQRVRMEPAQEHERVRLRMVSGTTCMFINILSSLLSKIALDRQYCYLAQRNPSKSLPSSDCQYSSRSARDRVGRRT